MIMMGSASLIQLILHYRTAKEKVARNLYFLLILLIPVSVLTSLYGSDDIGLALVRLRVNLGFFLIPLIVFCSPVFETSRYVQWLRFAALGAVLTLTVILISFIQDYESIRLGMSAGQPIPLPVNHIRLSMMIAFTGIGCVIYWLKNKSAGKEWIIYALLITLGTIFLSVRTGWLILGLGVLIVLIHFMRFREDGKVIKMLLGLTVLALLAFLLIPTVRAKIDYMRWDLSQLDSTTGAHYSDSDRIIAFKNGVEIFKNNLMTGVGAGDVVIEIEKNAVAEGRRLPVKIPHNQFLYTAVCGGIVSLLFFIPGYFFPFFINRTRENKLLLLMITLFLVTLFFEPTFETSMGVLGFVFLYSLLAKHQVDFTP